MTEDLRSSNPMLAEIHAERICHAKGTQLEELLYRAANEIERLTADNSDRAKHIELLCARIDGGDSAEIERLRAALEASEKKLDDWYRTEAKWNARVMQLLRDLSVSRDGHFEFEAYQILQGHREIERPADETTGEHDAS